MALDTGAMHVGRAVRLPMVVIGPAAESPVEWLPLGHPRMPTFLCAHREPDSPFEVPGEVKPEEVQARLAEVLERFPNGATATDS
jgi:ADP-heptose:LPS heptosyltransferase